MVALLHFLSFFFLLLFWSLKKTTGRHNVVRGRGVAFHQVERDRAELSGATTLHEEHLIIVRHLQQRTQRCFCLCDDATKLGTTMTQLCSWIVGRGGKGGRLGIGRIAEVRAERVESSVETRRRKRESNCALMTDEAFL